MGGLKPLEKMGVNIIILNATHNHSTDPEFLQTTIKATASTNKLDRQHSTVGYLVS